MRPARSALRRAPARRAPNLDATVNYIATRSPISDCHARYEHMVKTNRPEMIKKSKMYFDPWESIFEGNPMLILERGEKVTLPPMLIMQGSSTPTCRGRSRTVRPGLPRGGGECESRFSGLRAPVDRRAGPQTDPRARDPEAFIARQLGRHRKAAKRK
jgi:hypothetical protein